MTGMPNLSHLMTMRFMAVAFSSLILAISASISSAQPILLRANQTAHPLDAYSVGVLKMLAEAAPDEFRVEVTEDDINQTRAIEYLKDNRINVMWLASNAEVEEQLIPIRFPLLKGLLGHRICIINPNRQSKFNTIQSIHDLNRFKFGQGQGWPDVEILKSNGLNVITASKYDSLFYMVEGGRFDGFPRGVMEPWSEIAAHADLGLTVDKSVTLIYRLPFYLFVDKGQEQLANRIKSALDLALAEGRFDAYFFQNALVKDALERSQMQDRLAFYLKNPHLHPKTPLDKSEYWLDIKSL